VTGQARPVPCKPRYSGADGNSGILIYFCFPRSWALVLGVIAPSPMPLLLPLPAAGLGLARLHL
jgi:hypothetical protein